MLFLLPQGNVKLEFCTDDMCVFRIFWIKFALPFYSTIDGVFILYPISWVVGAVLMALYTKFGKWLPHEQMNLKK